MSFDPNSFPELKVGEWAVLHVEASTGIVLNVEGNWDCRGEGRRPRYVIFDCEAEAREYCLNKVERTPNLECYLLDHTETTVERYVKHLPIPQSLCAEEIKQGGFSGAFMLAVLVGWNLILLPIPVLSTGTVFLVCLALDVTLLALLPHLILNSEYLELKVSREGRGLDADSKEALQSLRSFGGLVLASFVTLIAVIAFFATE